jgi:hypothetical protein
MCAQCDVQASAVFINENATVTRFDQKSCTLIHLDDGMDRVGGYVCLVAPRGRAIAPRR